MKLQFLIQSLAARSKSATLAAVDDEREWSYRDLATLAEAFKASILELAIPQGGTVAVVARNSVETISLMIALGALDHTILAISPGLGGEARGAIYGENAIECELQAKLLDGRAKIIRSTPRRMPDESQLNEGVADADCPLMLTTSGSTGIPKVVRLSSNGIKAFMEWASSYFKIRAQTRVLNYSPLNFDLSLLEVWTTLWAGATLIISNPDRAVDAVYLAELVERQRPEIIQAVPMFYGLLQRGHEIRGNIAIEHPPKEVLMTGDVMPLILRKQLAKTFSNARFHNVYGCTETNDSFIFSCSASDVATLESLPIGQPVELAQYKIIGDDGLEVSGAGEGMLHVSTPFISQGYTKASLNTDSFYQPNDGAANASTSLATGYIEMKLVIST